MSIAGIVNGVGNIVNTLCDLSPKSFYSIADFYNFIKKRQNAPMARKHFTIVPRTEIFALNAESISPIWDNLFTDKNIAKFAITAQRIAYKTIGYEGSNQKISNQFGSYSYIQKGKNFTGGGTLNIDFLQTAQPIIESFIVPWFYECNRTNYGIVDDAKNALAHQIVYKKASSSIRDIGTAISNLFNKSNDKKTEEKKGISQFVIPKLTLDIKFYRMDQIAGLQFLMNPTFVYRIFGVYPISFSPAEAEHSQNYKMIRTVTFSYNNIICIPGPQYEKMLVGNVNTAFAYDDMSPIQLLNALNQTAGSVMSIASDIKGMF